MTSASIHQTVVSRHGPPDVLRWVETRMPEPRAGEVRLKVLAAGVSAFDLMYRRWGWLPGAPKTPFTLGEDVVGVASGRFRAAPSTRRVPRRPHLP